MRTKALVLATAMMLTATSLGGCEQVKSLLGRKPAGQVVATVNGEEITALELRAEMQGFTSRDPKILKQAQQAALEQMIVRKLVVQEAKKQKLDKSADFNLQMDRGRDGLMGQMYQRKIAAAIPVPTRKDADTFIAAHPEMFANRQMLVVEQIVTRPKQMDPARFQPLKTLEEVKALLVSDGSPFQETISVLDSASANPQMISQIEKLPPGEVFVIPQQGSLIFNRISQTRTMPVTGDIAVALATNAIRSQKSREAVGRQAEALRKGAEGKIVYNEAFKPTKPAKPPAAGAAGATTPPAATPAPKAP